MAPFPGRELAAGASPLAEDLPDRLEVARAAELLGIAGELLEQALRDLRAGTWTAGAEVDQLPLHAADGGTHLVVVDQLRWVLDERLLGVVERREPGASDT